MVPDENKAAELPEQLTAYLDGELDEASGRQVESMISTDPKVRAQMQDLDAVWGMLDDLPRSEADEQFTRTTVEMLALRAGADLAQRRAGARPIWWLKRVLVAAALVAAGFGGVRLADWLFPRPDDQLLRDLSAIQNIDGYRQVNNIQYLRELQQVKWLHDEPQP